VRWGAQMMIRFLLASLFITLFVLIVLNCSNSELRAQSLQEQATCAAQARKTFQEDNAEWDRQNKQIGIHTVSLDYESHYNAKINRCLMLVTRIMTVGNKSHTSKNLYDAIERRPYAGYVWIAREDKKYWEVPPVSCELTPTHNETQYCKSEDEFNAFVAKYMEE
jgi:hypothetical protein